MKLNLVMDSKTQLIIPKLPMITLFFLSEFYFRKQVPNKFSDISMIYY